MITITPDGPDFVLRTDAHLMQLILRSSLADLLGRPGSPAHRDLYDKLANAVRAAAAHTRWPLGDKETDVAEMKARLNGDFYPPLRGTTYWWHPESESYFTLKDGDPHPATDGTADGALCVEISSELYAAAKAAEPVEDDDDLLGGSPVAVAPSDDDDDLLS